MKIDHQQQQQQLKSGKTNENILTQIPILTFINDKNNPTTSTATITTTTTTTPSNALIDNLKQKTKKLDENNSLSSNDQLMSKFDDDDNVKIKNENPMISGQQQQQQRDTSTIERPKNLNIPLSCMLFTRQDSSMFAQPSSGCFNSPTFPALFAITPIEALHSAALLASPSMLTPTLSSNTTTSSSSSSQTTTTTTTTSNTLHTPQTHVAFAILKSLS